MTIKEALNNLALVAALDKEAILAFILDEDRAFLLAHFDDQLKPNVIQEYENLVIQRQAGKPLAYLLKNKEFYGLDFYVDERCLIPRPETEMIVEEAIKRVKKKETINKETRNPISLFELHRAGKQILKFKVQSSNKKSKVKGQRSIVRVLEVGTGSGCIAIALAKNILEAKVTAVDISKEALEVAEINVSKYDLQDRIFLKNSDLLEQVEDQEFDIIVANLPYIGEKKYNFVAKEVLESEPKVALFGGKDGLSLYRKLFIQIKQLNYQPKLIIGEFGFEQEEEMGKILERNFDGRWKIKKDLAGIPRIFIIKIDS